MKMKIAKKELPPKTFRERKRKRIEDKKKQFLFQ